MLPKLKYKVLLYIFRIAIFNSSLGRWDEFSIFLFNDKLTEVCFMNEDNTTKHLSRVIWLLCTSTHSSYDDLNKIKLSVCHRDGGEASSDLPLREALLTVDAAGGVGVVISGGCSYPSGWPHPHVYEGWTRGVLTTVRRKTWSWEGDGTGIVRRGWTKVTIDGYNQ